MESTSPFSSERISKRFDAIINVGIGGHFPRYSTQSKASFMSEGCMGVVIKWLFIEAPFYSQEIYGGY